MLKYSIPAHFGEKEWLQNRFNILNCFYSKELLIDFMHCIWIDFQPLCDLFLQSCTLLKHGGALTLSFSDIQDDSTGRVLRFLYESEFIHNIANLSKSIIIHHGSKILSPTDFIKELRDYSFPAKALDYDFLLPCTFADASSLKSRDDAYAFSDELREKALENNRAVSLRFPIGLEYQARLFFNTILPELVDNVRLHKINSQNAYFALCSRIRRREDTITRSVKLAEPSTLTNSQYQKVSSSFWFMDIVEFAFADNGKTIQETWLEGWKKKNPRSRKVPRMPETGNKISKKNADYEILHGVFNENASSLENSTRISEGLPRTTGLHSVKRIIEDSDCCLSVRSGRNVFIFQSGIQDVGDLSSNYVQKFDFGGIFEHTPGVSYMFKLSSTIGRPLEKWPKCTPHAGILKDSSWWVNSYPTSFDRVHTAKTYEIPKSLVRGDVLVCKVRHLKPKYIMMNFIKEIENKGANLVFYDVPAPVALYLYNMLRLLNENIDSVIPIISESFRIRIHGNTTAKSIGQFANKGGLSSAWWGEEESPIKCVKDLFNYSRKADSIVFWESVSTMKGVFLQNKVEWDDGIILKGGFLSVNSALRSPMLRKLILRRFLSLLFMTECKRITTTAQSLHFVCSEYNRHFNLRIDNNSGSVCEISNVVVDGDKIRIRSEINKNARSVFSIPIFIYPDKLIECHKDNPIYRNEPQIRLLDWNVNVCHNGHGNLIPGEDETILKRKSDTAEMMSIDCELKVAQVKDDVHLLRVCRRNNLLKIGHYSYGKHHYFAWIDLRKLLAEKTPDSTEMIDACIREINDIKPDLIVYKPHEVVDAFLNRLLVEVKQNDEVNISKMWPITDTIALSWATESKKPDLVLYIDDGLVTGKNIRGVKALLQKYGCQKVSTLVMINRGDPSTCISCDTRDRGSHFSWWNFRHPSLGTSSTCKICRGIDVARFCSSRAHYETFRVVINNWINSWSNRNTLDQFDNALENINIDTSMKLPVDNSKIPYIFKTSSEVCFWILHDCISKDSVSSTIDIADKLGSPSTEIFAALILYYWDYLSPNNRERLLLKLINRLWIEERPTARSLAIIAMLSLTIRDLTLIQRILKVKISSDGLTNSDTVVFTEVIFSLTCESRDLFDKEIGSLFRKISTSFSASKNHQIDKCNGYLSLLSFERNDRSRERIVIEILGVPGRSAIHHAFSNVLRDIKQKYRDNVSYNDDLVLLDTYVEELNDCYIANKHLFERYAISNNIQKAVECYREFKKTIVTLGPSGDLDPTKICDHLDLVFNLGSINNNSYRKIMSYEFAHYLPIIVYEVIKKFCNRMDSSGDLLDFNFIHNFSAEERDYLKIDDDINKRDYLIQYIYNHKLIGMMKTDLFALLEEVLSDVKHAKRIDRRYEKGGKHYMEIQYRNNPQFSNLPNIVTLTFKNRASREDANRASEGPSLRYKRVIESSSGFYEISYNNDILTRTFGFSTIKDGGT